MTYLVEKSNIRNVNVELVALFKEQFNGVAVERFFRDLGSYFIAVVLDGYDVFLWWSIETTNYYYDVNRIIIINL